MVYDRAFREGDHSETLASRDGGANASVLNTDDRMARKRRSHIDARLCIAGDDEGRRIRTPPDERGDSIAGGGDVIGGDDLGRVLRDC
jgi:hypothetical protein